MFWTWQGGADGEAGAMVSALQQGEVTSSNPAVMDTQVSEDSIGVQDEDPSTANGVGPTESRLEDAVVCRVDQSQSFVCITEFRPGKTNHGRLLASARCCKHKKKRTEQSFGDGMRLVVDLISLLRLT